MTEPAPLLHVIGAGPWQVATISRAQQLGFRVLVSDGLAGRPGFAVADLYELADITDPSVHYGKDQIFFGSTVNYEDEAGTVRSITILGVDEADTLAGQVSWVSPVARALLKARVGDEVSLVMPDGVTVLSVISVDYPKP